MNMIKKNEKLMLIGKWTSTIGNIIFDYANNTFIIKNSIGKVMYLSVYQSLDTITGVIFNLIGGVYSDKYDRKKIVIYTDIMSAIICFLLSFFNTEYNTIKYLIISNVFLGIIYSFNSPANKSLTREVIAKNRMLSYNSIANAGNEVFKIISPVISIYLINLIGWKGAMQFNAVTFIISAISEAQLIKINKTSRCKKERLNIFNDIKEGFLYLVKNKLIFILIIVSSFINFFLAGYNLLLPYTNIIYNDIHTNSYGIFLAMQSVGGILGSLINTKIGYNNKVIFESGIIYLFFNAISMILIPIFGQFKNLCLLCVPFIIFGASLTVFNIRVITYIQNNVNENYLGRIFSIIFTVSVLFMPLGSLMFPLILNVLTDKGFFVVGVGILMVALVGITVININNFKKLNE